MNSPIFLLAAALATLTSTTKASTVTTFDVLVATTSVSIGTSAPTAQLEAWRPQNGAHFAWFASSGAFRVGKASGSQWNSGNLGSFSVALGTDNQASGAGSAASGGNLHLAAGDFSTIAGGFSNETDDDESTVSGGLGNAATAEGATVGGGNSNLSSQQFATVGGGDGNFATGVDASIPGGHGNTASGQYSFAAGVLASAEGVGSFVWADSQFVTLRSLIQDEFKARAGGGFVLLGVPGSPTVIVSSGPVMISTSASAVSAMPSIYVAAPGGEVGIGTKNPAATLDVNGAAQFGSGATKSTFTANVGGGTYALQLSSGLTLANGGPVNLTTGGFIRFPDGTISATAAPESGLWQQIASSVTLGGSTSVTFTVPESSGTYWLSAVFSEGAANALAQIRFNGDTGSNYTWVDLGLVRATTLSTFNDSDTSCSWGTNNNAAYNLPANGFSKKNFWFDIPINKSQYAIGTTNSGASDASGSPNEVTTTGTCFYRGASRVSSVTILTSASNFAGTFRLFQMK